MQAYTRPRNTPVLSWLDRFLRMPLGRQVVWALLVSLAFHALLLAGAVFYVGLKIAFGWTPPEAPTLPQEVDLQVVMEPEPEPDLVAALQTPTPKPTPPIIDSTGLAAAEAPPENPVFQSDQDMRAASRKKGTGTDPLPSIEGSKDIPVMGFSNQKVRLGPVLKSKSAAGEQPVEGDAPAPEPPPAPMVPTPEQPPQESPVAARPPPPKLLTPSIAKTDKTVPVPEEPESPSFAARTSLPANLRPLPLTPAPRNTPLPIPRDMAMLVTPPSRPMPIRDPGYRHAIATPQPKNTPKPAARVETEPVGFQKETYASEIDGSISNIGDAAVDAAKTPLGVYQKHLSDAIGSRWHYYVKQQETALTRGLAKVRFNVTAQGKIKNVQLISNTGNDRYGAMCRQSVREAEIDGPPPEVGEEFRNGQLELTFTFNYF